MVLVLCLNRFCLLPFWFCKKYCQHMALKGNSNRFVYTLASIQIFTYFSGEVPKPKWRGILLLLLNKSFCIAKLLITLI